MSLPRFVAVFVLASVFMAVLCAAAWMVGAEVASAEMARAKADRDLAESLVKPCEPCPPPQIPQKEKK